MDKKGIALAAVILLITFVAIAVLGATSFIAQRLVGVEVKQRDMRLRYNAQAGLHYAIYQYRQNGTLVSNETKTIDADNYCVVNATGGGGGAGDAALLDIDGTGAYIGVPGQRYLYGVTLKNTSTAKSIRIDNMIVTWTGVFTWIRQIVIHGATVYGPLGFAASGSIINITNVTIPANTTRALNYIYFWSNMNKVDSVTLQFQMSDGNWTSICEVIPQPASVCHTGGGTLTINSMGKTTGSGLYRTVQATYDTATGNISDYTETTATVP